MTTGFYWDEQCFWHGGGDYAFTLPSGGLVQPMPGGLPENPETKRRLKNLMDVTGLSRELSQHSAPPASYGALNRVHPASYLQEFKTLSDQRGGDIGLRAPFGAGGYDIAARSAGLAIAAVQAVLDGTHKNAYALSRPPGHHCLPDFPNGFCLLANIAVAIHAARAQGGCGRVAVLDWDVHHGNGTEAIFYDNPDVLTISMHQTRNYPLDTGDASDTGTGAGIGANMNIPLPPGAGHATYMQAMETLVTPAIARFHPDIIIIACGFDAAAVDPLGRMMASADTFEQMTKASMALAADLCNDRLVMIHEGGYSEVYVPFCGHAVIAQLANSNISAPDPLADTIRARQPDVDFQRFLSKHIEQLRGHFTPAT